MRLGLHTPDLITGMGLSPDHLVEFEMERRRIAVLGVLQHEDHEQGHDGDYKVRCLHIGYKEAEDHEDGCDDDRPVAAGPFGDPRRERREKGIQTPTVRSLNSRPSHPFAAPLRFSQATPYPSYACRMPVVFPS
jgi:hypothetical protein